MVWLLGVEVLPNLHLAFHQDDHTHADNVLIRVTFDAHPHVHDEHEPHHTHAETSRPERSPISSLAIDVPAAGHVAGGFAHRCVALHDPVPPITAIDRIDLLLWELALPPADRPSSFLLARATARGPPSA